MNRLNKEFDDVICINLASRQDKKIFMSKKFNDLGISVNWFNTVEYGFAKEIVNSLSPFKNDIFPRFNIKNPNEFGAAISHYSVIKTALEQGLEKIFVFEDDALFIKDFNTHFEKAFNKLPTNWDMFLLYTFMYKLSNKNIPINNRWLKAYNGWSMMAYGMNRKAMKEYIKIQDENFQIADLVSFKMQQNNDLNIYSVRPTLCIPNKDLGSNIRNDNMNYVNTNTILNLGFSNENYK